MYYICIYNTYAIIYIYIYIYIYILHITKIQGVEVYIKYIYYIIMYYNI